MSNDRDPGDKCVPTPPGRNRYHPGRPHDFLDVGTPSTNPLVSQAEPCTSPDLEHAEAEPCSSTSPGGSRQMDRPGRPGAGVTSDSSGKTHEGKTGVSGETAETDEDLGDDEAT